MQQPSSASAEPFRPDSTKRGVFAGTVAGIIAIGCCVGPVVAVLLGIVSAATAIDLATNLYDQWGWAFKLAGIAFSVGAITLAVKRSRTCEGKPRLLRFLGIVAVIGVLTYGLLYAGTTWLGTRAGEQRLPQIQTEG